MPQSIPNGEGSTSEPPSSGAPGAHVRVLGIAQDGGVPHIGCRNACCARAWTDLSYRRHAACAAVLIPVGEGAVYRRWLVDATPDLRWQLRHLDVAAPAANPTMPGLEGILLTHAHYGHVAGLAALGREAAGARGVAVWAMPRLLQLLGESRPWARLVEDGVILPRALEAGRALALGGGLSATPLPVPHRTALSETVAFRVQGPRSSLLWLPDVDAWDDAAADPRALVGSVDRAYLDGTFFDGSELPGRDRSRIAHPTMSDTLERARSWPEALRARLRFIHLNHSNPALWPGSPAREAVLGEGCGVAEEGEIWAL